jgi:hypothetical protein
MEEDIEGREIMLLSSISVGQFLHIYGVHTSRVTFLYTRIESVMFLQVICFVTLRLITRRF